jgi:hypothetical protein
VLVEFETNDGLVDFGFDGCVVDHGVDGWEHDVCGEWDREWRAMDDVLPGRGAEWSGA